ncbi:MAG: MgtC/SapB family protein [Hyphomicrobiales bacterium]
MYALIGDLVEPALKLLAAVVVGALVGLNRDLYGKPAGLRLCALVSLGSGLVTMIAADRLGAVDPTAAGHAIQGIVGGVGFLGAGVILHDMRQRLVRNLNTAATIWISAALGIACGLGAWRTGTLAAILALIVLTVGLKFDRALYGRWDEGLEPERDGSPDDPSDPGVGTTGDRPSILPGSRHG